MASKLITIVGITGTQVSLKTLSNRSIAFRGLLTRIYGASVADAFINEPGWKIRGISREPRKESSKAWTEQGVEMVSADLDNVASLEAAFKDSNVLFGVTDFWQQMQSKKNHEKAEKTGERINVISFEAEIQQGKNLVDAAQSTMGTLDVLVLSVLTDSRKWSGGKITWNYHFESKWRVVEYLQETYPELHEKSSFFQAACYLSNLDTTLAPKKVKFKLVGVYKENAADRRQTLDGYVMSLPIDGDKQVPMIHARNDTGPLVKALIKAAPGKNLMGYSSEISFNEIAQIWSKNLGAEVKYERGMVEAMDRLMPGGMGMEFGEALEYLSSPGYYGGEAAIRELNLITPDDLGSFQLTEVREYLKGKTLS